jgi:hypothetical protein
MKEQDGRALITVWLCMVFLGSIGFVGLKLAPIYIEHFGVTSSLESMRQDGTLHGKSITELRHLLNKRLEINDVRRVDDADVEIKTNPRTTTIRVAYEVQVPLMSNIDFLVTFDNRVELY